MDLFRLALRDLWEKKLFLFFITIEILLLLFFFLFTYQQVRISQDSLNIYESLELKDLTYFVREDPDSDSLSKTGDIGPYLAELLDENMAYILIPTTAQDVEGETLEAYIALGRFAEVYDLNLEEETEPFVWPGAAYSHLELGDTLSYGEHRVTSANVKDFLPSKGGFFAANRAVPFNEAIIVPMDYTDYTQVAWPIDIQEYLMWSDPHPEDLNELLQRSEEVGLRLLPQQTASQIGLRYESLLESGAISALTFAVAIVFVLTAILLQLYLLLSSKHKEIVIHQTFGARNYHILTRVAIFIYLLLLIPLVAYNLILQFIPEIQIPWIIALAVPLPMSIFLTVIANKLIRMKDHLEKMKGTAS